MVLEVKRMARAAVVEVVKRILMFLLVQQLRDLWSRLGT
jgi:hypothetical protein